MVLLSFSIEKHIPLIKSGAKTQTTRIPRKPRHNGAKPYSVGERVQLYYRSRQRTACANCIVNCDNEARPPVYSCSNHSNFFGESEIIAIDHYSKADHLEMCEQTHTALLGSEIWKGLHIGDLPEKEANEWAVADGFPEGINEAHEFFVKSTGDKQWMFRDLDVIKWDGTMIARQVV